MSRLSPVPQLSRFAVLAAEIVTTPRTWLVTGAAGFIGSNLVEWLLRHHQRVVGLDNFSTGYRRNLELAVAGAQYAGTDMGTAVGANAGADRFTFIEGDIRDFDTCQRACAGVDFVLHQAALGSVPRSIEDPVTTNASNVTGFLHMLTAARDAGVAGFVYAASSSTYGDEPTLPKQEDRIGRPLSPYAVTKYVNELYADVFAQCYGFAPIGLRYFNVFGPRQDPDGAYAAVIPKWFAALLHHETPLINGDGETSRDFCYIDNVIQANILAALADETARGQVYNVAFGQRTTLNELFALIRGEVCRFHPEPPTAPVYQDFRAGDVRHSLADITRAQTLLGYAPTHDVRAGLHLAADWYATQG